MAKILIVEDDDDFATTLIDGLTLERHTVERASTGTEGAEILRVAEYDVIVLDWNLPGMDGIDVLKSFRAGGGKTPVLMLTGKGAISDKAQGLDTGADDYLTKPFDMRELVARVRALLRRREVVSTNTLQVRDIVLDPVKHRVTKGGESVHILPRDFALLEFFMRHPDEVFPADTLLARVWQFESEASAEGLRAAIRRIRKALDGDEDLSKSIIENISRVGYRLRM
jgi:DNA-binding response OmpR family regulator